MKRRHWIDLTASVFCSALPTLKAQGVDTGVSSSAVPSGRFETLLTDLPSDVRSEIEGWTRGRMPSMVGMTLQVPELVENGNDVPLRVAVQSPMTPEHHVRRVAVWAPRNPKALALEATFTPMIPRAELVTRIRLASTQRVLALAELSDGQVRCAAQSVLVALAACIEG